MAGFRNGGCATQDGGCCFVWVASDDCGLWSKARAPASVDDVRLIEDIALREIRAAKTGRDAIEVARLFSVRRLSSAARERIEAA
jgi:hypothetical protein